MKKLLVLLVGLLTILVAGFWFVNSELLAFVRDAKSALSDSTGSVSNEAPANAWTFAVVGDTEDYSTVTTKIIEDMASRDLAFVAHVGDISSHGAAEELVAVRDAFATLPFPTYFVPGNNDLVYDETIEIKTPDRYQELIRPDLWYAVDFENAHLVFLDNSYRRFGFPDDELAWLETDLAANIQPHTFLFFHRPLDVPGQEWFGDDETEFSRGQNEKFKALVARFPITRIFTGHLHTTLGYSLDGIPVTVTGGGGALPQTLLGGADAAYFHYYLVHVPRDGGEPVLEVVEIE